MRPVRAGRVVEKCGFLAGLAAFAAFTSFAASRESGLKETTNAVLTVAEANAVRRTPAEYVPEAVVRGVVVSVYSGKTFFLEDATGNLFLSCSKGDVPVRGERIEALIRPRAKSEQWKAVHVLSWRSLGKADVPPPVPLPVGDVGDERYVFKRVALEGVIEDVAPDELDPKWYQLLLKDGKGTVFLSRRAPSPCESPLETLVGARVRIVGTVMRCQGGGRLVTGPCIGLEPDGLTILRPPPEDPFDIESLPMVRALDPEQVCRLGRRRTEGTVEALWCGRRGVILSRGTLEPMRVELVAPTDLAVGTRVCVVGTPTTDRFNVRLKRARIRSLGTGVPYADATEVRADELHRHFGRLVRLTGSVRRPFAPDGAERLELDCGNRIVFVDACGCTGGLDGLAVGSRVFVTGVCLFESDEWRPDTQLPRVSGYVLVPRRPADIVLLAAPSWWTTDRLLVVVIVLVIAILAILVWNRMQAYAARIKLEERTRLAVELHDTIAQNLTGLAFQVDAAQLAAEEDPSRVLPYLRSVVAKMGSCRQNLRACLWDLRNRTLDEKSLDSAILRTVCPHVGSATVKVDCDIACSSLSENTLHAVLCILRELVINAIRHGKSPRVVIRGTCARRRLSFAVTDDGCGFDPEKRPGVSDAHYGLQGVRERVSRLGGAVDIRSSPGHGCTVTLTGLKANG